MNTHPTQRYSPERRGLDSFESTLLAELREHVAQRTATPVPDAAPARRRHLKRWSLSGAAAAIAATAAVVASTGGIGASSAYAVDEDGGEVVVIIHRLEDSSGLEQALRDHGIDADVSFSDSGPEGFENGPTRVTSSDVPESLRGEHGQVLPDGARHEVTDKSGSQGQPSDFGGCGLDNGEVTTLDRDGDDWVLRIPAGSPLQDRHVEITTDAYGSLMVFYASDTPDSYCAVLSGG